MDQPLWIIFLLIVVPTVFAAPLSLEENDLIHHRESTPEILDLEQQLKKQAGEDKKFMPKESNPLPQIDGLADEETKEQQAAALATMIKSQDEAGSGGLGMEAKGEEGEAEAKAETKPEAEVEAEAEPEAEPVAEDEVMTGEDEAREEVGQELPSIPVSPLEDQLNVAPDGDSPINAGHNYDDMFYMNLIQSVKDNPDAWEKLLKEHRRLLNEELAYQQQMKADLEQGDLNGISESSQPAGLQGIMSGQPQWGYPYAEPNQGIYKGDDISQSIDRQPIPNEDWQYFMGDAMAKEVAKKRGYSHPDMNPYDEIPMQEYDTLVQDHSDRSQRSFVMM